MIGTLSIVLGLAAVARPGPDAVLIIRNDNSALSRSIAEYYAIRRRIPAANICAISTAADETVSRDVYISQIERPVAACLRSRGLAEKILYVVTTMGVPLRVRGRVAMDGDNASVDSELTLLYAKMHGTEFTLNGMVPNPFFGKTSVAVQHPDVPIYLVTRLAAYDFNGVKALIDRAQRARNTGKFVIDARSGDDQDGDRWLRDAAIRLPSDRTVFDATSRVLYEQKDVIGYASWGSNDKNHSKRRPGFQWLPGAIMTEFVSTNARTFARPPAGWNIGTDWDHPQLWFAGAPQSLITDYLDEGASGASGNIDEPYLNLTARPDILLPAYASGRNLAEAYYLSIPGLSWQNIVVGDPLCSLAPAK